MKIYMVSLFHRATINYPVTAESPFTVKTIDCVHQTGPRKVCLLVLPVCSMLTKSVTLSVAV